MIGFMFFFPTWLEEISYCFQVLRGYLIDTRICNAIKSTKKTIFSIFLRCLLYLFVLSLLVSNDLIHCASLCSCSNKLEEVIEDVNYIRYLKSLPMDSFEPEIWSRFGHECLPASDRRKVISPWNFGCIPFYFYHFSW